MTNASITGNFLSAFGVSSSRRRRRRKKFLRNKQFKLKRKNQADKNSSVIKKRTQAKNK